jgi:thymidine kinase
MSGFVNELRPGWVEVIVGSMYSGKTEELIRRIRRAEFARLNVQVFKPKIDDRYSATEVASHNRNVVPAIILDSIDEIWAHLKPGVQVVGIDEGQFFSGNILSVVQDLAEKGVRVLVAGLDTDWKGQPFEPMPALMAIAESVTKQHAVCVVCGSPASRTQRVGGGDGLVEVGASGKYEARCRKHFVAKVDQPTTSFSQFFSQEPWLP